MSDRLSRIIWSAPEGNYDFMHFKVIIEINNTEVQSFNMEESYIDCFVSPSGEVTVMLASGDERKFTRYDKVHVSIATVTMCGQAGTSRDIDISRDIDNNNGKYSYIRIIITL